MRLLRSAFNAPAFIHGVLNAPRPTSGATACAATTRTAPAPRRRHTAALGSGLVLHAVCVCAPDILLVGVAGSMASGCSNSGGLGAGYVGMRLLQVNLNKLVICGWDPQVPAGLKSVCCTWWAAGSESAECARPFSLAPERRSSATSSCTSDAMRHERRRILLLLTCGQVLAGPKGTAMLALA